MSRLKAFLMMSAIVFLAGFAVAAPATMSVQVKKGELRSSPSFLSAVVTTVAYGDRLTVEKSEGLWMYASPGGGRQAGWIHSSALTTKRIAMKAGDKDAALAASSGEMALAGKGFNSAVEAEFKNRNHGLDFTWVDRMEQMKASPSEMQEFLAKGAVAAGKGGAR